MKISKDTSLGEIAKNSPQATMVLLKYGLHCIGCSLSPFETLEEGARGHGLSDEQVERLVKEINEAARVSVTVAAAVWLAQAKEEKAKDEDGVRLYFEGGWCMRFDKQQEDDRVVEAQVIRVFYDKSLDGKIDSAIVDLIDGKIVIRREQQ